MHIFVNADYSFSKDFILSLTLHGISRAALHTPIRAPPVTPSLLPRVARTLNYRLDRLDCTLHCAFLFSFFLMACLANIVPSSKSAFDYKRHLMRGDVAFSDTGLLVTFKCTKTIQFGERPLQIPLLRIDGSPLSPVAAYTRMVQLLPANSRSAVFIMPSLGSYMPLTKRVLVSSFREHLAIAGVEHPHSYRGHSFRRGAASWAFIIGIPGEIIQIYGDWTSDTYKRYLEFSLESKVCFANTVHQAICPA